MTSAIIATLSGTVRQALASPDLKAKVTQLNLTIGDGSVDSVKLKILSELSSLSVR